MLRVTVSIYNEYVHPSFDLEIPAEQVTAAELDRLISNALGWSRNEYGQLLRHSIYIEPAGRLLAMSETLADIGCWDGSTLRLETFLAATLVSNSGKLFPIRRSEVLLGRASYAEMGAKPDELIDLSGEEYARTVSRTHSRMIYHRGQWQICHISTTNQTLLNNYVMDIDERLNLRDGDIVELGGVRLVFLLDHVD